MSKKINVRFLIILPLLAFLAFFVATGDFGVLAQNANSSTTEDGSMQDANHTMTAPARRGRGRRGRRGQRRRAAQPAADANVSGDANMSAPADANVSMAQDTDTGVRSPGEAEDLSGTYTGRVRMSGGHEMSGEGTLTITGNTFTLASEGMTHNGKIIAITTRGYTGATLWFTDLTDSVSNTPLAAGVRVRKGRNTITMTPVPGSRNKFWFNGRAG